MRSLFAGSGVARCSRWRLRSSSSEISGRLPNQVLDELETDPVRPERGSKVVHEAADHIVGQTVEGRVMVTRVRLRRQAGRLRLHRLHLDLEAAVGRPEGELERRLAAPGLAAGLDGAVTSLGDRDVELVDVLQAEADEAAERGCCALGGRDHLRLRQQLELGEEVSGRVRHGLLFYASGLPLSVPSVTVEDWVSSSWRLRRAAATPSRTALPTGCSGSLTTVLPRSP